MAGSRVNHSFTEKVDTANTACKNIQVDQPSVVNNVTFQSLTGDRHRDSSPAIPDNSNSSQNSPIAPRITQRCSRSPRHRRSRSKGRARPPSRHENQQPQGENQQPRGGPPIRRPWDSNELNKTLEQSSDTH